MYIHKLFSVFTSGEMELVRPNLSNCILKDLKMSFQLPMTSLCCYTLLHDHLILIKCPAENYPLIQFSLTIPFTLKTELSIQSP